MPKIRNTNMNIHHKNMKQIAMHMQVWTQKHLSPLGIYECTYNYFNLDKQLFMPIPMVYSWYCEYMEKGYDLSIAPRLKQGTHYWTPDSRLMKAYRAYMGVKTCYKLDLVKPTASGYELLIVGSKRPLTPTDFNLLQSAFYNMSLTAHKIRKEKPNTVLDFEAALTVKQQLATNESISLEPHTYHKSKFDQLILTPKEQQYIEYLMLNLSYKQIATQQGCSEIAVRKVLFNIKRKLGDASMPIAQMLKRLNELGVLGACLKNINMI